MTAPGKDVQGSCNAAAPMLHADARLTVTKRRLTEALLAFVLVCLASVGGLVCRNMHAATLSEQWETHSRLLIQQWGELLSRLKDAETRQRGFIITGNPEYLEPCRASLGASYTLLASLRRLTPDSPAQQQWLAVITPLVTAKLASLQANIALRETQGFTAASQSVMAQSGKPVMDEIRTLVAQAQEQEQQVLNEHIARSKTETRKISQSLLLAGVLGSLALLLLFVFLRWELRARRRAEAAEGASELQYRTLFNLMDEGFCILEIIFDKDGQPVDYLCHEANPAFEEQTGIASVAGKRLSEIAPGQKPESIATFAKVLETGEPARIVRESVVLNRWFDVYAFRLGARQSARVAVLFSNITGRKRSEDALRLSNQELTAFNRVAVDRELRTIELKHEVNALCGQCRRPPRYDLAFEKEQP